MVVGVQAVNRGLLSVLRALFSVPGTHTRPFIDNQLRSVTRVVAARPKRPLARFSTPVYHVAYPHQRGVAARQLSTQWEANHILCRFSARHPLRNTHTHTYNTHTPRREGGLACHSYSVGQNGRDSEDGCNESVSMTEISTAMPPQDASMYETAFIDREPRASFQALQQRMRQAKVFHEQLADYMAARYEAEEAYIKQLQKLPKRLGEPTLMPLEFRPVYTRLVDNIGQIAQHHTVFARQLQRQRETLHQAPMHGEWSGLQRHDDALVPSLKELQSLEIQLSKDQRKVDQKRNNASAQSKLATTQQAYARAQETWKRRVPSALRAYEVADFERLSMLREAAKYLAKGEGELARGIYELARSTAQAAKEFDPWQDMMRFSGVSSLPTVESEGFRSVPLPSEFIHQYQQPQPQPQPQSHQHQHRHHHHPFSLQHQRDVEEDALHLPHEHGQDDETGARMHRLSIVPHRDMPGLGLGSGISSITANTDPPAGSEAATASDTAAGAATAPNVAAASMLDSSFPDARDAGAHNATAPETDLIHVAQEQPMKPQGVFEEPHTYAATQPAPGIYDTHYVYEGSETPDAPSAPDRHGPFSSFNTHTAHRVSQIPEAENSATVSAGDVSDSYAIAPEFPGAFSDAPSGLAIRGAPLEPRPYTSSARTEPPESTAHTFATAPTSDSASRNARRTTYAPSASHDTSLSDDTAEMLRVREQFRQNAHFTPTTSRRRDFRASSYDTSDRGHSRLSFSHGHPIVSPLVNSQMTTPRSDAALESASAIATSPPQTMSAVHTPALVQTKSVASVPHTPVPIQVHLYERVNAIWQRGRLDHVMVVGEVRVSAGPLSSSLTSFTSSTSKPEPVRILLRLLHIEAMAQTRLGSLCTRTKEPDLFELQLLESAEIRALDYQVHVPESEYDRYLPLLLQVQWRCEPTQSSALLMHRTNPAMPCGDRLEDVSFQLTLPADTQVTGGVRSEPVGEWDPDTRTFTWRPTAIDGRGAVRFPLASQGTPQPISVTWRLPASTPSPMEVQVEASGTPLVLSPTTRMTVAGRYSIEP